MAARASRAHVEQPPAWALLVLAAWVALLLLAPPESNWFWAVNGFRSIPLDGRLGLVVAAIAIGTLGTLGVLRTRAAWSWAALSAAVAWTLAFPLREKIHFLGDSALRIHTMAAFSERAAAVSLGELFNALHATPLDVSINFFVPIALHRAGVLLIRSVSILSLVLAAVFLAGVWRLTRRVAPEPGLRLPVAVALVMTGALEAFAGYAESTGLLLALAPWWWAELLEPLATRRQAGRVAGAWAVLTLGHRMALVMLAPMLWRSLGPPLTGDQPAGRRALLVGTAVTAAVAIVAIRLSVGTHQLATDLSDAFALFGGERGVGLLPPADIANLFVLVAPLAFLAPLIVGGKALVSWLRTPEAKLTIVAAAPLLPLAVVLPAGPHGFGAHRDWDLAVLCGWTLTLAGVCAMTHLSAPRVLGVLPFLHPVLVLGAGSWVAANAHEAASVKRALALASKPPLPAAPHLGSLHLYLGQRAMDNGAYGLAGRYYDRAYDFSPNPRFLLLAAEAWVVEGDSGAASRDVARARASGGLNARGLESGRRREQMIAGAEADSGRAGPPAGAATTP